MAQRQLLQNLLKALLGSDHVYFQPPPSVNMQYPCIVYERDRVETDFADNVPYKHMKRYQITIIDRNPDSLIPDLIAALPMCSFDRRFTADGLHHDVYNLFF